MSPAPLGRGPLGKGALGRRDEAPPTINATATQSLSIAQAASAQVLVSAAAAQPLSLAQSATAQVIVQAVASQPLGLNQSATAQIVVGATAAQALGIVQDVSPIRILPQPLGGWLPTPAELKRIRAEQRVWKREARERTQWLHAFEAELRSTYDKLTPKPPEPPAADHYQAFRHRGAGLHGAAGRSGRALAGRGVRSTKASRADGAPPRELTGPHEGRFGKNKFVTSSKRLGFSECPRKRRLVRLRPGLAPRRTRCLPRCNFQTHRVKSEGSPTMLSPSAGEARFSGAPNEIGGTAQSV